MLRKIAFGLIAVAVLWFGVRALVHALASDETLIRLKFENACDGFDHTRMSPILDFLSHDFVDERTGAHRDDVRTHLAGLFFSAKDPKTRGFPYRAEIVPGTLSIEVDPGTKKTAHLRCTIRVMDTSEGGARVALESRLSGELANGEDGWQLVRTLREIDKGSDLLR
jgi:hypothetical protein